MNLSLGVFGLGVHRFGKKLIVAVLPPYFYGRYGPFCYVFCYKI